MCNSDHNLVQKDKKIWFVKKDLISNHSLVSSHIFLHQKNKRKRGETYFVHSWLVAVVGDISDVWQKLSRGLVFKHSAKMRRDVRHL